MHSNSIEKRKFGRRATFKSAEIVFGNGEKIGGFVIDLSEGGARFQSSDTERVPEKFTLQIPADDFTVECRLVHLLQGAVGVEFVASPRKISWGTAALPRLSKIHKE